MGNQYPLKEEEKHSIFVNILIAIGADVFETNEVLRRDFCERHGLDFKEFEKEYEGKLKIRMESIMQILYREYGQIDKIDLFK